MRKYVLFLLFSLSFGMQSCDYFKLEISEFRPDEPFVYELNDSLKITSTGVVYMMSSDFLPSSFMIQAGDKIIYIDPLLVSDSVQADYILITHAHMDHLSLPDVKKLSKEGTIIVGPKGAGKKLKDYWVSLAFPGESFQYDDLYIECVPAYSIGFPSHPMKAENVGYIIKYGDNRIYHSGDTDLIPELFELENINLALIPLDGGKFTMQTNEAAQLINEMKPDVCIPMHYRIGQGHAEQFGTLLENEIQLKVITP